MKSTRRRKSEKSTQRLHLHCRPRTHQRIRRGRTCMPEVAVRELTMAEAVREALSEEMRRDPSVFIMGEDVAEAGTPFKVLSGMVEEFGKSRVIDTPISEPGFTGIAVGAAMTGLRPVGHHVRRFQHSGDGPAGESGGEDPLHVRRRMEGTDGVAARRSEPRAARPRSTRNRFRPGSAMFPD